jgi:head-tail adaptor
VLTAAELTAMRDTLEDSLVDTAILKTRQWVSDGGGGGTTTYVAAGTVECRVAPVSPNTEKVEGERLQPDSEYVFTFAYDTAISDESLITYAGRNFTVTAQRAPRTWEVSRRVEAKEVK